MTVSGDLGQHISSSWSSYFSSSMFTWYLIPIKILIKNVQNLLNITVPFFANWRLHINFKKSSTIIFSKCLTSTSLSLLDINNTPLVWTNQLIHLGQSLDSKMIFKIHIHNDALRAQNVLRKLNLVFKSKNINLYRKIEFLVPLKNSVLHRANFYIKGDAYSFCK